MRPVWDTYYHPTGYGRRVVTGLKEWRALVGREVEFTTTDGWDDYQWDGRIEAVAEPESEYGWPLLAIDFGEGGAVLVEPNRSHLVRVYPNE